MGRQEHKAWAALLAVQALFGAWPVAAKILFEQMGPVQVMAARIIGAAVILGAMLPMVRRRIPPARNWKPLLGLALSGVVVNQTLFLLGLERTTATHATLAITTIPVFTYAIAVALGRESLGPRRAAGIGLALAGAVYLVAQTGIQGGWHQAIGDLMILANAVAFSAYLVFSKPYNQQFHPLSVTAWTFMMGAVVFLPVAYFTDLAGTVTSLDGHLLWWLAFAILGPSVLTYVLNAVALQHVPASTVAVFIYLQPIITALLAAWLLGDQLSWRLLPPAALVFSGVWLVARRRPKVLEGQAVTD